MKRLFFAFFLVLLGGIMNAQTVNLTFTACNTNGRYIQLDRVVIDNLTEEWQETLYWPDTVLTMSTTGIGDVAGEKNLSSLQLSQNTPNPFDGVTYANLVLPELGNVMVEITDISGHIVKAKNFLPLQQETHQLRITLSTAGVFFLTVRQNGQTASIKMVNRGKAGTNNIDIADNVGTQFIASESDMPQKSSKYATSNPFVFGDQMIYVGYATINDEEIASYSIEQAQDSSQTVTLVFNVATDVEDGQPCPGTPTVTDYDGNIYNTVKIGNQCWMRENLRTTHYADGSFIPIDTVLQSNNDIYHNNINPPYRYAPNGDTNNVGLYGWLYNWPAVMHGVIPNHNDLNVIQGVCPEGWHVPSCYEWDELEACVRERTVFVCGDTNINVGKALAATRWWNLCEETCCVGNALATNNATSYTALPAGSYQMGVFTGFGQEAHFSSANNRWGDWMLTRNLYYNRTDFSSGLDFVNDGFSVRCVRD